MVTSIIDQDELSLDVVIKLLAQQCEQKTVVELTRNYCFQTTSEHIKRAGMEFLYMNGLFHDLQALIYKNMQASHPTTREWAYCYQMMIDRRLKNYSPSRMLKRVQQFQTDDPALKYLLEFIKLSIYYDLREFDKIGDFLEKQQYLYHLIDDRYLVNSFRLRMYNYLFIYYWKRNELIMARMYAFRALNMTLHTMEEVNLHIHLGLSYTFDTLEQGMYHLKKARDIAKSYQLPVYKTIINKHIPFLCAHFKQTSNIKTVDKLEQAHLEIARGNHRKALIFLNNVSLSNPFALYYLGLAKRDEHILFQAYNHFIEKRSDYFFARLPLHVLRNNVQFF